MMRRLSFFLVLAASTLLLVTAQFEGFGGEPKFCPPFRCKKDEEPVPKWPLKLESTGCSGMGGMQIYSPGMNADTPQELCCDLRQACIQTCGSSKDFCDKEFLACGNTACENLTGEEKKTCESSSSMNQILVKLDTCQKYDAAQYSNCECVPKEVVPSRRERVLRAFYKKFNPDAVDKVPGLAAKADTPAKMVGLLLKLYKKYPAVIRKIKDPQQEAMDKLMKEAAEKAENKGDDEEDVESDAEDLGTDEL